ncbi:A/G-specific adenine glycosylase [Tundrisphaera sp. TA3]|uniref:A/G-specific adenine glycosylase n=1 Tax=Tundrisphaera sp. TA3 TaxID=3435775 RepID=UPI003EBC25D5
MARKKPVNTGVDSSGAPDLDPAWIGRIREKLDTWYRGAARKLPWREDRDPYRILVSEMMLVQTTVAAVIPYFARFLARFPDLQSLAEADEADVLKAWEGLGYYRRARQLHAAARAIQQGHGGVFPSDPDELLALPGVGRYIAGAVLSFSFDRAAPIVEANTQRVLARWLAWEGDLKASATQARLWEAAGRLVPQTGSGDFNQAFMELGALVCIPRGPLCLACPVSAECRARALGLQDRLPIIAPKPPPREVAESCALVTREGRLLLVQRGKGRLWENFWELPTIHLAGHDPAGRSFGEAIELADGVLRLTGVVADVGPPWRTIKFGVTTHKVTLTAHHAKWLSGEPAPGPGLVAARWVEPGAIAGYTLGAATRRILAGWGDPGGETA